MEGGDVVKDLFYLLLRLSNDANAIKRGRVPRRLARRYAGKVTGRAMGRIFG